MRLSRCFAPTLVIALVIAILVVAVKATAAPPHLSTLIAKTEVLVWRCQDQREIPRTPYSVSPWALPRSHAYRAWTLELWQKRLKKCRLEQQQHTIPTTGDWQTSVRLVQRVFPGTASWLLYISHREGGWGSFKMNYQGSGCGGWMQFMPSTYYAYAPAAFAAVRSRGFTVDPANNDWRSPLGQAITAGYMKWAGREGCHWCL